MSDHAERDRFENEGSFSHPFAAPSASERLTRLVEPEGSLDTSRYPKGWTQEGQNVAQLHEHVANVIATHLCEVSRKRKRWGFLRRLSQLLTRDRYTSSLSQRSRRTLARADRCENNTPIRSQ